MGLSRFDRLGTKVPAIRSWNHGYVKMILKRNRRRRTCTRCLKIRQRDELIMLVY